MDTRKLIRFSFAALFGITPLLFSHYNSELFEVPKMYFIYFLATIIGCLHLYNFFTRQSPLYKPHFLNLFVLLFLLSQVVATVFSIDAHTSIFGYYSRLNGGLLSTFVYSALFFILMVYIDENLVNLIINISLVTGSAVAAYGIGQHFGIDKKVWVQDVQSRIFSTLGQPNWLAAYLCILLPLAIHRLLNSKSLLSYSGFSFLVSIFWLSLLFTKSKSGIAAAIISLVIFFLIYIFTKTNESFIVRARHAWPLLIILTFLTITINNPVKDYAFKFIRPSPVAQLTSENPNGAPSGQAPNILITPSEDIRKIVWRGALDLWRQFPYFGTGPETFAYSYYWTRPVEHNLTSEWDFLYNKAHNEYLNYLATTGTFGLISYLLLILATSYLFYSNCKFQFSSFHLALFSAFLSILITNSTGFSVSIVSLFFFLIPALIILPIQLSSTSPLHSNHAPNFSFAHLFIAGLIFIFSLKSIASFYFADIIYASALRKDAQNNINPALTEINSAINLNPDEPSYHTLKAQILAKKAIVNYKENPQVAQEYTDSAIIEINTAIASSPANINLLKEKAQVYYYLSALDIKHYATAIETLLKITKLAPTDAKTFYTLGKFWEAVGNSDQALINYEQAIKLKSNYDHAYFAAAKLYFEQKEYPKAKDYFDRVLSIAPANPDAPIYLDKIHKLK